MKIILKGSSYLIPLLSEYLVNRPEKFDHGFIASLLRHFFSIEWLNKEDKKATIVGFKPGSIRSDTLLLDALPQPNLLNNFALNVLNPTGSENETK